MQCRHFSSILLDNKMELWNIFSIPATKEHKIARKDKKDLQQKVEKSQDNYEAHQKLQTEYFVGSL